MYYRWILFSILVKTPTLFAVCGDFAAPPNFRNFPDYMQAITQKDNWRSTADQAEAAFEKIEQRIRSVLRRGPLYNQLIFEGGPLKPRPSDWNVIETHAVTSIIPAKDFAETKSLAGMVYLLHVFDDILDKTVSAMSPTGDLELLLSGPDLYHVTVDVYQHTFHNLRKVFFLMRRLIRNHFQFQPSNAHNYYSGLGNSLFLLFIAAKPFEKDSVEGAQVQLRLAAKMFVLAGLSEKLRGKFSDFSGNLFRLTAKSPMGALYEIESQAYSPDRTFLWSLIFAPFLYDFAKRGRPEISAVDENELFDALNLALSEVLVVPDERRDLRIVQLHFMLTFWPHKLPERIQQLFRRFLQTHWPATAFGQVEPWAPPSVRYLLGQ